MGRSKGLAFGWQLVQTLQVPQWLEGVWTDEDQGCHDKRFQQTRTEFLLLLKLQTNKHVPCTVADQTRGGQDRGVVGSQLPTHKSLSKDYLRINTTDDTFIKTLENLLTNIKKQ